MKTLKKMLAVVLAVVMLMSIAVTAFAADYSFEYYFADENMKEIYVTAFSGEIPEDGYVEIPERINGYKVVGIAEHTFDNLQELRGIIISDDVTYIDEDAFYGCTQEIDIVINTPEEPEEDFDEEEWFEDHKQDYVIEGDTLVKYKGSDKIITIPYNCSKVAKEAFKNNLDITTVYLVRELKVIEEGAFEGCKYLANVYVANGTTDIEVGRNAFAGTAWLKNYPSEFVSIGTNLIKYKGVEKNVIIPNVFKSISSGAFYIDENDNTADIAFKVRVPMSVERFGEDCFHLYDSITKVYPELVVYKNSAADKYLNNIGIDHVYASVPGDANCDNVITAGDARYVLRVAAKLEDVSDDEILFVGDITGDNKIAADDARRILRIAAKLEKYSVKELYSIPRTDHEVLLTAANALSYARAYGCAYSKNEYQYLSDVNMNTNTKTYLSMFNKELTPEKKAVTVTYDQDTPEAYENLFDITLLDASKIKSHSCIIKDGKYYVTIVLSDEVVSGKNVTADTFTSKMFPVETVAHFTSKAMDKYWYNDSIDYTMTYNDCTLNMVININNMKVDSIDLQMNYDFSITGKIMGIDIKDGKNPATATRTDVVKYSNFVYFSK